MTNGEFYILAATIVLASALTRYVSAFYYQVFDADEPYLPLTLQLIFGLIYASSYLWGYRYDILLEELTYAQFMLDLLGGCAFFLAASMLSGTARGELRSPREHFMRVRRYYFPAMTVPVFATFATVMLFPNDRAQVAVEFGAYAVGLVLFSIGFFSDSDRIQRWVASALVASVLVGSAIVFAGSGT